VLLLQRFPLFHGKLLVSGHTKRRKKEAPRWKKGKGGKKEENPLAGFISPLTSASSAAASGGKGGENPHKRKSQLVHPPSLLPLSSYFSPPSCLSLRSLIGVGKEEGIRKKERSAQPGRTFSNHFLPVGREREGGKWREKRRKKKAAPGASC